MGQPRGAPLLIDLLADQNFRPPAHVSGQNFAGFVNADPKPGEAVRYPLGTSGWVITSDESSPGLLRS